MPTPLRSSEAAQHQEKARVRLRALAETFVSAAKMIKRCARIIRPARRAHRVTEGFHRPPRGVLSRILINSNCKGVQEANRKSVVR